MANENLKSVEVNAAAVPFANSGLEAPTYFVDDIRGASLINGVVRLNLVENRVDVQTEQIQSKVVAILAVPLEIMRNWGPYLTRHFSADAEANTGQSADNA